MPTWKSKICRGMDVVESITFTRQDTTQNGKIITASACYVPAEQKPREEWSQAEIDAVGESIVEGIDKELDLRARVAALESN